MAGSTEGLRRHLQVGVIQGLAAWSAYAVLEFLASSVVFRITRPYARFTTWHWSLTAQLMWAYLDAGILAGALAGLLVFRLRKNPGAALWTPSQSPATGTSPPVGKSPAWVLEHVATLTLVLAAAINMAATPALPAGWWTLLLVALALIAVLVISIRSETWSVRFGLLANPWMVAGLLLGSGEVWALPYMGVAGQFGARIQLLSYLLLALLAAAVTAAVWLGPRWRPADRIPLVNWAAPGLALALLAAGTILGRESTSSADPAVKIAGSSAHPNVIVVVMDTVRAGHLSLYGYPRDTTPNLKKLAADSTLYPQAVSAADITLTSHASLFTGLYASWHGAYCQPPEAAFGRRLSDNVPTLAEILTKNGYHTLGVAANLYLRENFGLQRGFQQFRIPRPVPVLAAESWYMLRTGMRSALGLFADTAQFDRLYSRGDAVNRAFFDLLQQPDLAQAPFFAFFNYMDAHYPYIPPHPFDRLFPGKASLTQAAMEEIQKKVVEGGPLPAVYPAHAVSQYDGGIAYIDAQIGQLVDWLKRGNLYDHTMLIVTADHGEAFGEGGRRLFLHGNALYANLLHVGLLVKYPNSAHKGVENTPVSLVDVFPTVLKAAGVEAPPGAQGRDLLAPGLSEPRLLYAESFPCAVIHQPECPGGCLMRAVLSWPDKFIWSSIPGSTGGKVELYQLQQDPHESRNLFGSLNPVARELTAQLKAWVKTMPQQAKQTMNMSPADIQHFKALGYIQ